MLTSAWRSGFLSVPSVPFRDTTQISRGKFDRLQHTTAGSTLCALDGCGLRSAGPPRPALTPHTLFLFIGSCLCSTLLSDGSSRQPPLRFASPSVPSTWAKDFHLLAIEHARHTLLPLGVLARRWERDRYDAVEQVREPIACVGSNPVRFRKPPPGETPVGSRRDACSPAYRCISALSTFDLIPSPRRLHRCSTASTYLRTCAVATRDGRVANGKGRVPTRLAWGAPLQEDTVCTALGHGAYPTGTRCVPTGTRCVPHWDTVRTPLGHGAYPTGTRCVPHWDTVRTPLGDGAYPTGGRCLPHWGMVRTPLGDGAYPTGGRCLPHWGTVLTPLGYAGIPSRDSGKPRVRPSFSCRL